MQIHQKITFSPILLPDNKMKSSGVYSYGRRASFLLLFVCFFAELDLKKNLHLIFGSVALCY